MARDLVVRDTILTEPADALLVEGGTGLRNDPGTEFLAIPCIRHAENLDIPDLGVPIQILFDFTRVDVLAAADDHVLDPADDAAISGVVDGSEVAGMHPPGGIDGFPGPCLVIPVTEHHGISSRAELAGLSPRHDTAVAVDDLDLEVRLYPSDRRDTQLERIVAAALEAHGTGFGHPIGDGDLAHMHGRGDFLHDLDRAWCARHDPAPQRAEVEEGE